MRHGQELLSETLGSWLRGSMNIHRGLKCNELKYLQDTCQSRQRDLNIISSSSSHLQQQKNSIFKPSWAQNPSEWTSDICSVQLTEIPFENVALVTKRFDILVPRFTCLSYFNNVVTFRLCFQHLTHTQKLLNLQKSGFGRWGGTSFQEKNE